MNKRKRLGQHFLTSKTISESIVSEARIGPKDTVLEVGTGTGILTPLLCKKASHVISIEADKSLYDSAKSNLSFTNLELKYGNAFKRNDQFTVFVSNLPYSKSRDAIEWLATRDFSHGVIMVQKEFAEKILDKKEMRAVGVIANHTMEIAKVLNVSKNNFAPPPKVDSVVLQITKKKTISPKIVKTINQIFSYRRKTIQNIYKQFGKQIISEKRLDDLSGDEIVDIAKELAK